MSEPTMTLWHERWVTEQIGWHRTVYNDMMVKHWASIDAKPNGTVLVPLCGKSLDMVWLAERGHDVIGLEMVELAVETFFREQNLTPEKATGQQHTTYRSGPYTVYHGDALTLEANTLHADAWYDRAAMIALPATARDGYVQQLRDQTSSGAVGLLITYAYPQHEMEGPPFSLPDEEVYRLFSDGFTVERLENMQLEDERGRGLSTISSSVFKIQRI